MSEPEAHQPIPQFESLAVSGAPVSLQHERSSHACRIARTGEDEALVVYQVREDVHDVLLAPDPQGRSRAGHRRSVIRWKHQRVEFGNNVGELTAWPDGNFAIRTGAGWIFAAASEAGLAIQFGVRSSPISSRGCMCWNTTKAGCA